MNWLTATIQGDAPRAAEADHNVSSVALVRAVANGDGPALELLYGRYSRELHWFIYSRLLDKQLAEEVLQDVMLAVWRGAARFRGRSSVRTWLYSIAYRRAASAARKLPRRELPDGGGELLQRLASDSPGPAEWAARNSRAATVRAALAELPEHQRVVVELVYLHGLTGAEVAGVLRVPVGTVKSRRSRALRALAPLLEELAP